MHEKVRLRPRLQGSAKKWSLGCAKRSPAAREGQDAGITQPRDHYVVYCHSIMAECGVTRVAISNLIPFHPTSVAVGKPYNSM